MRKVPFVEDEFYHVYNRGVDKRNIFSNKADIERFFQSMLEFNTAEPIGSIYELEFAKRRQKPKFGGSTSKSSESVLKLVEFVAYCLNPNHYHFILTPCKEKGIEKFMHRLSTGYTRYFNDKHKRSGSLFQGRYKAIHVNTNEYLLHVSAYVNLNDRVHQFGEFGGSTSKLVESASSWDEYTERNFKNSKGMNKEYCKKDIVLGQFDDRDQYKRFAESSLQTMLERKKLDKEMERLLLE